MNATATDAAAATGYVWGVRTVNPCNKLTMKYREREKRIVCQQGIVDLKINSGKRELLLFVHFCVTSEKCIHYFRPKI